MQCWNILFDIGAYVSSINSLKPFVKETEKKKIPFHLFLFFFYILSFVFCGGRQHSRIIVF